MSDTAAEQPDGDLPAPKFDEILDEIAAWQKANGVPELTEEEAMEMAVAETKKVRAERAKRLGLGR